MSIEGGRWLGCCYLAAAVLEAQELHRLLRAVHGDDWMKTLHELFRIDSNLEHRR
jgi:hypothetical protein